MSLCKARLSSAHDAQNADNARKNTAFPPVYKKWAEPQKKENPTRNLTILRGILVRSRELESLALWLKEPTGQVTLILEVSSLRHFYAKHRDFSLCNFCTLCRILQVRVPIASLETVQKQCRNRALTLGQMKNDNFNHWLDGGLSDHKGESDIQKEECPLVWGVLRGVGSSA